MKFNYYLLLFVFILGVGCKKEKLLPFTPKNYLSEYQTEKAQIIDLDTIDYKEIVGKHGTKLVFYRELFDVKHGEKIQLELIELYDFKEILYRNIQTLTTDNKLLESSGVLKVTFRSNGKELKLAKEELLKITPPKGKLKGNDIFLSQQDSLGNITWDITNQNYCEYVFKIGGGLSKAAIVSCDSIPFYEEREVKRLQNEEELISEREKVINSNYNSEVFYLKQNTSQWVNIDRIVSVNKRIAFELENEQEDFSGFNIYFNYENLNSFMYETRMNNELNFNNIPLSEKTTITVIGEKKEGIFYDKIELKESMNNTILQLNMKKTSVKKLKKMFD